VALGASVVEKHFTSDKRWPGPDVPLSIDPSELGELMRGARAVFEARGGSKEILPEEQPTIDFAYACVVSLRDLAPGVRLGPEDIWVKRPGTGEILAGHFESLLGREVRRAVPADTQLRWDDLA
jgi:N-acetylneuraminate synthase